MPALLPLLRYHARCPTCGVGYHIGFAHQEHVRRCVRKNEPPTALGQEQSDVREFESDYTDAGCSVGSEEDATVVETHGAGVCPHDAEIVRHFADDKDRPGLLQCTSWGAKELSPQEKETFRFLQVVDAGDGTSGRVAQGMLNYARELGGNGLLLPRSIKRCWQILDQVLHCVKYEIPKLIFTSNFLYYIFVLPHNFKFFNQILMLNLFHHLTILNYSQCTKSRFTALIVSSTGPCGGPWRGAESHVCVSRAT